MRVTSDVMVAMRDGVNIAVRIYQPDDDGAYPTLFAISIAAASPALMILLVRRRQLEAALPPPLESLPIAIASED